MKSLDQLGFNLFPVDTVDGTEVFRLQTGFRLADKYPFDIFVEDTARGFHVWDEGLTYHNLLSINPSIVKGSRFNRIQEVVSVYDVSFTELGMFEAYGPSDKATDTVCDFISAMVGLDRWVLDIFSRKPEKNNLVESAKLMFKRWKPKAHIQDDPRLEGYDGMQLEFDFSVDEDDSVSFVDVFAPVATSTAGFMRKAASFNLANLKGCTLGIVDNQTDDLAAQKEIALISTSYRAMSFSALVQNANSFLPAA